MRRQQRNLDEFARGYIKTDPDWTQRMWCNWAFHRYREASREELHLKIISLLDDSESIKKFKNIVKILNNSNIYGNNIIATGT